MYFSQPQLIQLVQNGQPEEKGKDHIPVVKLYLPGTGCIWLLTEIGPEKPNMAFGLYDLADGKPVLGPIDLSEILQLKSDEGRSVIRDPYFVAKHPISIYERAAKYFGYITEVDVLLIQKV